MKRTIPIFLPRISDFAVERATEILRSGWISEGKEVKNFERRFCKVFNLSHALAVNSGTAALHLAVLGAGVGPGDEVITTTQTFVATAMAVMYAGATPVFADIKPGGPNIDPADIEHRITPRTKAIIPVHYGGYPCDMDEINEIASRHGLSVIEDAAHAIGATYKGKSVGSFGRFSIFSFQAIKLITTGDGGMLVCRDEKDHQTAYRKRWFGIDRVNRTSSEIGQPEWDISEIGYKYHMNDISASLGVAHLEEFPEALERRRVLNELYRKELNNVPGLTLLQEKADRQSACWLFTVLVDKRLYFIRAMKSHGVEVAVWHQRIDRNSLFGGLRKDLPNQTEFDKSQVSIPLRNTLSDEEVGIILHAVRRGW